MKGLTEYFGGTRDGNAPCNSLKHPKGEKLSSLSEEPRNGSNPDRPDHSNMTTNPNGTSTLNLCDQKQKSLKDTKMKKKSSVSRLKLKKSETTLTNQASPQTSPESPQDTKGKENYQLRIKMKTKQGHCMEDTNCVESISGTPVNGDSSASASKTVKSPQGTLLKYFIHHSTSSNGMGKDLKRDEDIKNSSSSTPELFDCKAPGISGNEKTLSSPIESTEKEITGNIKSTPEECKKVLKNKSSSKKKKSIKKKICVLKEPCDESVVPVSSCNSKKRSVTNCRRKLSLKKSLVSGEEISTHPDCRLQTAEMSSKEDEIHSLAGASENLHLSEPVVTSHASGNALSGYVTVKHEDTDQLPGKCSIYQVSDKCKPNILVKEKHCETIGEICKDTNMLDQISSFHNDENAKKSPVLIDDTKALPSEGPTCANEPSTLKEDSASKGHGTKRNSLMNYFSKMSKEEAIMKGEKVELEVQVMVHSPPVTPSKKKKRRSLKSLPGGSTTLIKKKIKTPKFDQGESNVNAIDVVAVEEIKLSDYESGVQLPATDMIMSSPSSLSHKVTVHSTSKQDSSKPEVQKKIKKKAIRSKSSSSFTSGLLIDSANLDSAQNKIKLNNSVLSDDEPTQEFVDGEHSSSIQAWKLRVCLVSPQADSSGTLHTEEKTESEKSSINCKRKKRKLSKRACFLESSTERSNQTPAEERMVAVDDEENVTGRCAKSVEVADSQLAKLRPCFVKIAPLFTHKPQDNENNDECLHGTAERGSKIAKPKKAMLSKGNSSKEAGKVPSISSVQIKESSKKTSHSESNAVKLAPLFRKTVKSDTEDDSDEEMFPIRKKNKGRRKINIIALSSSEEGESMDCVHNQMPLKTPKSPEVSIEKEKSSSKKDVKFAPLFNIKGRNEARQQFLQSGMPEQMKRIIEVQRSFDDMECDLFPKQSHIQQKEDSEIWNLVVREFSLFPDDILKLSPSSSKFLIGDFTTCTSASKKLDEIFSKSFEGPRMAITIELPFPVVKPILKYIRSETTTLKVAKTYRALQKKYLDDKQSKAVLSALSPSRPKRKRKSKDIVPTVAAHGQVWTEKYKPTTSSEIIGSTDSVRALIKWLEAWRQAGEEIPKQSYKDDFKNVKRRKKKDDMDDFVVLGDCFDEDSRDLPNSSAILFGPTGCGKTSTVYAVARDLGYKVLEVNASEKRSGKVVLSKLSEATQSHQVQSASNAEQGFQALFMKSKPPPKKKKKREENPPKLRKEPGKLKNQSAKLKKEPKDEKTKKMSLILFEDVDILFEEEDDGFLAAVSNLIFSSKRPVILTATDPDSIYLSRFISHSCLQLEFFPDVDSICTWLQLVSLIEGKYVAKNAVNALVLLCRGDFRRALLQMQLWVTSGGNNLPMTPLPVAKVRENEQLPKGEMFPDDDALSSDGVEDGSSFESPIPVNTDCLGAILGRNDHVQRNSSSTNDIGSVDSSKSHLEIPFPLDIGLYWWNIPCVLLLKQICHCPLPTVNPTTYATGKTSLLDNSFIESFCSDDEDGCDISTKEIINSDTKVETNAAGISEEKSTSPQKLSVTNPEKMKNCCTSKEMEAITRQIFCISTIDIISSVSKLPETIHNMEPVSRVCVVKDGLSLSRMDIEGPDCAMESTAQLLCHWLAQNCLNEIRNCIVPNHPEFQTRDPSLYDYTPYQPSLDEKRWRSAHKETENQLLNAIPYYLHLENRAVFVDYIPTLRTFCRLEHKRNSMNTKRRRRFYHYLRSLNANLTDSQHELLCRTMCTETADD